VEAGAPIAIFQSEPAIEHVSEANPGTAQLQGDVLFRTIDKNLGLIRIVGRPVPAIARRRDLSTETD
jgi:hypothetical protein